ncbi:MAG: nucleotide exchange factor GrpE [bacterium]
MTEQQKNQEKIQRDEFENDLELLKKKNQEYLAGWQRAKADYLNLKKESERKYQEIIQFANAGLIIGILPVLDNFKLAIAHIPEDQKKMDWVIGIMHIKKQLEYFLHGIGIEVIKTVGEKFNPELHEAVEDSSKFKVESSKLEEEKKGEDEDMRDEIKGSESCIIIKEVKAGYTMHGKIIQPAKVIVG